MEKVILKSNGRDVSCQLTNDAKLIIDGLDPINIKGLICLLSEMDFNFYIEYLNDLFYSLADLGAKIMDSQDEHLLCSFPDSGNIYALRMLQDALKEMKNES